MLNGAVSNCKKPIAKGKGANMKKSIRKALARPLLASLSFAYLFGCNFAAPQKQVSINGIGWVYENIDPSYWSDGFSLATCFAGFSISYTGDNIAIEDIDFVRWHRTGEGLYYNFPIDEAHVDTTSNIISSDLFFSNDLTSNGSAMPIGTLTFEIGLTNSKVSNFTFDVPAPGQGISGGNTVTYTEDYQDTILSGYVPMLKRPIVDMQTNNGSTILIAFHSNDPIYYNGFVIFYNSANELVARSPFFRIWVSGEIISIFDGIYNDGRWNSIRLMDVDLTFETGKGFDDITKYRVILTDGAQYAGTGYTYDCLAIGALTSF